nr:hypothetical protein [Burkholderiaceae bacterium]
VYALIESRLRGRGANPEPAPWRCDLELDLPATAAPAQEHPVAEAGRAAQDLPTGSPKIASGAGGATTRSNAR